MDVNYHGTLRMCREVGRLMLAEGRGSIVNMSALGGGVLGIGRGNAAYCSTKGAVAPCWFRTDMNATSTVANRGFMGQVMTKLPMKRIGEPEDLVGPVVFLASDASSMITGLVLPVDGGAGSTCPIEWKPQ